MPRKAIDLTGQRFFRLTVVERMAGLTLPSGEVSTRWLCVCDCGNYVAVSRSNIGKSTKSCGCYSRDAVIDRSTKHGMEGSPEYQVWASMKHRCLNMNNRKWPHYGGRGISVCDEWVNSFQSFIDHIGLRPGKGYCIDRINNDGNYEPGNVRWATSSMSNLNRRGFGVSKNAA